MARDPNFRRELGQQLRVDSVRASAAASACYLTGSRCPRPVSGADRL
jgi:hypothetical protein